MLPIVLATIDDFWNTLLFGNGGWLYIILVYAIVFMVSAKFRWFGFIGVLFSIFAIFGIIQYGNTSGYTLDLAYRIVTHVIAMFVLFLVMAGVLTD